jgi:hypothetical protein
MISAQGRRRLKGIADEMNSYKEIYRQHAEIYQSRLAHMALAVMSRIDEIQEILNENELEKKNDCVCKRR